jgi:acyl-coenzyme A synthetase/AMP-(fatty) acid ligase
MLYQRWTETVASHANDLALREADAGRAWTFRQLAEEAENETPEPEVEMLYPAGNTAEFILTVLRGWRAGRIVCPVEPGQPQISVPRPDAKIAHLKLTSGTTGCPKCVAFTEDQLAADADAIVATMDLRPDAPNLGVISLAHSYGFSNLVLPLLLHGIPLALVSSPLPVAIISAARMFGNSDLTLPAVPAMWRAWHAADAIPANVRLAISAGSPLPLPLEEAVFARNGLKLHNFLGASECGGIAFDATTVPRTEAALAGLPLRGVGVDIANDGRLRVRSPAVAESYWPEPDDSLGRGVFLANDLVELTPDGGILLCGRAGDVINVAGRKVSPESIESVLRMHPAVRECVVFGMDSDAQRGEAVVAVVEAADPRIESDLREFALARMPAWQVPRTWRFVEDLAPNGRGKLSRAEWRQRLAGQ